MFNFETGAWRPENGVIAEWVLVPDPTPVDHFHVTSPAIAVIQSARYGERISGFRGVSQTPIAPGDRIALMPTGEFVLELQVSSLRDPSGKSISLSADLIVAVSDPVLLASILDVDQPEITDQELAQILANDGSIQLAARRVLRVDEENQATELGDHLREPLSELFGLTLRQAPEHVVVAASSGLHGTLFVDQVVDGRWRLVEPRGRGHFGEVWKVAHTRQEGLYRALKVVRQPEMARAINREARRLVELENSGINYSHLARLMEVAPTDPPYLLYEYVDGPTLDQYVESRGGKLSPDDAIAVVQQMLAALGEVHRAGMVHRDLHPGNVIVTSSDPEIQIKVLDLGLALPIQSPRTGTSITSPSYAIEPGHPFAEPAWQRGNATPDERTDTYSVGVLFWWLTTGQAGLPAGQGLDEVWPNGPANIIRIVNRACVVERTSRYSAAGAMLRDFGSLTSPITPRNVESKPTKSPSQNGELGTQAKNSKSNAGQMTNSSRRVSRAQKLVQQTSTQERNAKPTTASKPLWPLPVSIIGIVLAVIFARESLMWMMDLDWSSSWSPSSVIGLVLLFCSIAMINFGLPISHRSGDYVILYLLFRVAYATFAAAFVFLLVSPVTFTTVLWLLPTAVALISAIAGCVVLSGTVLKWQSTGVAEYEVAHWLSTGIGYIAIAIVAYVTILGVSYVGSLIS